MSNLKEKIDSLSKAIETEKTILESKSKWTAIIYGILIVIVLAYTLGLYPAIKNATKPEIVSNIVMQKALLSLPQFQAYLQENAVAESRLLGDNLVLSTHSLLEYLDDEADQYLNTLTDKLLKDVEAKYLPQVHDLIVHSFKIMANEKDVIGSEKELASTILANDFEKELNVVFDEKFFAKIAKIQKHIVDLLDKDNSELTKQELAEKRIMMCWLYFQNINYLKEKNINL